MNGKRTLIREWTMATVMILFAGAAPAKAPVQVAIYPLDVCKEWSAYYNMQPGRAKTLHVTGICTFPSGGYAVKLIRRRPKDAKTANCVLDLAITAPTGIGGIESGIRHIAVHYSEQTEQRCDSVNIEPDHVTLPVKIIQ